MANDHKPRKPSEFMLAEPDNSPRIAFCCLLAIGGAALVTKGVELQGFMWWFLLIVLLGTLLEGNTAYAKIKRLNFSAIIGLFFVTALIGLFILTGVGPSNFAPNEQDIGVDFTKIPERLNPALTSNFSFGFIFICTATIFGIYMASLASSHTMILYKEWQNIPDEDINSFKKRWRVSVSVVLGIVALATYFTL
jgi:hypothetical protein